ncbi:MAG: UDP-N-acetylmuramoyl-tripeptide--D-alanyl-D-alanine ligase [Polyangiaceae bacterium]|nr:UDP-N-acetylmuramoyl-tripeptide--D-alanyl-D-alanine ligase [Polyangiaceae bacterium]
MATPIPKNRASFSLAEIVYTTGGTLTSSGDLGENDRTTEVSTDTRSLDPGALFVALSGETFDAHRHLDLAVKRGARVILVEQDNVVARGAAVIRVPSTLAALGDLARAHAQRWRSLGGVRKTVAITGSAGKTTTRVATQALLERLHPGQVHATKGNLNNLVGAPMVLFGLESTHRYAVVEIGMSIPGEIEKLARMVLPDVGLVTLVAAAHVEACGSIEGVAHEKGALYRALSPQAVAIGNADNDWVRAQMSASPAQTKVTYGTRTDVDVHIAARAPKGTSLGHLRIERRGESALEFDTPLLGEAGAYACAAAVSIAASGMGDTLSSAVAGEAFANAEVGGGAGRLLPINLGKNVILMDDSYNANPASMRASIRAASELAAADGRRLVLVLGEMRELGVVAEASHEEVGRAARESAAGVVIAVGKLAEKYTQALAESSIVYTHRNTAAEAAPLACEWVLPGDLVLIKGSRGIGTDVVVRALTAHLGSGENTRRAEGHA